MSNTITDLSELFDSRQIPVFIGVGGHRNIRTGAEDVAAMKKEAVRIFKKITQPYKNTRFIVLTSLASGADMLLTEAAEEAGLSYAAVLPMPEEIYLSRTTEEKDGTVSDNFSEEDKKRFLKLKNSRNCLFVYTMPSVDPDDPGSRRQFVETTRFISDNSFAGIELWDGILKDYKSAGTGSTVRDAMHGRCYLEDRFSGLTIPETRPIYHIYAPRADAEDGAGSQYYYKTRELFPEPLLETGTSWFSVDPDNPADAFTSEKSREFKNREAKVAETLNWIDTFNRDAKRRKRFIKKVERKQSNSLALSLPGSKNDSREGVCDIYYTAADAMAQFYQKHRARMGILLILLACVGYMCLDLFTDDIVLSSKPLIIFAAMILLAFLVWYISKKSRVHGRFVDYRAVAEGLRVQYYWYAAGILDEKTMKNAAQVQDYYLRRQKGHIDWVRAAIRSINLLACGKYPECADADCERLKTISDVWIGRMDTKDAETGRWVAPVDTRTGINKISKNGQTGYFLSKIVKNKKQVALPSDAPANAVKRSSLYRKSNFIKLITLLCVFLSIGLSLLLAGVISVSDVNDNILANTPIFSFDVQKLVTMCIGALPIISLLFKAIGDFMGYDDDIDRYTWYYRLFKRAMNEIDLVYRNEHQKYDDLSERAEALKGKLFEIGKESLVENADWVMINEKREPEIPEN